MKLNLNAIFCILLLGIALVSCKKDDDDIEPHDPVAQALIDDDLLVDYLQTHYYIPPATGESFGVIDTILNGEESLFALVETQSITHDDISYKLYYLILEQGANDFATRYDSVFVDYKGFTLDSVKFDENKNTWLNIGGSLTSQGPSSGVIQGWKYGFPHFKSGTNVSVPGEPITFENSGSGILFMPSGLAYGNDGSGSISPNESILFFINLNIVIRTDYDNDGVLNEYEDLNTDGEIVDDDTDGDFTPDFIDTDDDGDGILTKDENPDPNGDGNPADAEDSDNDGTPDYLDADS